MKPFILALAVLLTGGLATENLLKNPDFEQGFSGYFKTDAFSLDRNVLNIRGVPEAGEKVNGNQKLSQTLTALPAAECPNLELELSFQARIERISGRIDAAIREIDADGKTIRYHAIPLTRWDASGDWQPFNRTFKLSPRAAGAALFIQAFYLDGADLVQLRNLRVVRK